MIEMHRCLIIYADDGLSHCRQVVAFVKETCHMFGLILTLQERELIQAYSLVPNTRLSRD